MKKKLLLALSFMGAAMLSQAQGKIGGTATVPNPNAFLQLGDAGANKGLLMPRVALSATNLPGPLSAHVEGMYVYNTANAGTGTTAVTPGLYYNDGTQWARVVSGQTSILGSGNPKTTPPPAGTFSKGTIYSDTLTYLNNDWTTQTPNTDFGQQWTYDGTKWISYNAPASTEWYLAGGTNDAGGNKTSGIYRLAEVSLANNENSTKTLLTVNGGIKLYRTTGASSGNVNGYLDFNSTINGDYDGRLYYNTASSNFNFISKATYPIIKIASDVVTPTSFSVLGASGGLTLYRNTSVGKENGYIDFQATASGLGVYNGRIYYDSQLGRFVFNSSPGGRADLYADGNVYARGYQTRNGSAGSFTNHMFNIDWTGTAPNLWVDNVNVGAIQVTSDRRLKENIQTLDNSGISLVNKLRPVSFTRRNIDGTIFHGNNSTEVGFIADELQNVIPSAVTGEPNAVTSDGKIQPQTLNLAPVISVLTKAIQEQQAQIEELKQQVAALKAAQ